MSLNNLSATNLSGALFDAGDFVQNTRIVSNNQILYYTDPTTGIKCGYIWKGILPHVTSTNDPNTDGGISDSSWEPIIYSGIKEKMSTEGLTLNWNAHLPTVEVAYGLTKNSLKMWTAGLTASYSDYWLYTDGTVWNGSGILENTPQDSVSFEQITPNFNASIKTYVSNAEAGQTVFNIPYTFTTINVFVNGSLQLPNINYTTSNSTLTFTSELDNGDVVYVFIGNPNITTNDKLNRIFTSFALQGQTTLQIPYDFSTAIVYINGVLQNPSTAYSIGADRIITFSEELYQDDEIVVMLGDIIIQSDDYILKSELSNMTGELLIGSPKSIDELRSIFPSKSVRIKTLGAFSEMDGGAGEWIFDISNMSSLVSSYPNLFIAPSNDPSGSSGAWRLNIGNTAKMVEYGVGITNDRLYNSAVINQFVAWSKGKKYCQFITGKIYITELNFNYNPKFICEWGVNSELISTRNLGSIDDGTVFMSSDSDSSNPVITISGTVSKRLSGIYMRNVAIISEEIFNNRDLSIPFEYNVRSSRTALKLDYIASAIDVKGLTICGYNRAIYASEIWDGSIRDLAVAGCSDIDGTMPAIFIGSDHSDNSNALTIERFRIEHCPFSLECGFIEHVRFINGKIETKRQKDATNYVVKINSNATRYLFDSVMFVTDINSSQYYLYDQGRWPTYNDCWFTIGSLSGYYAGIKWIYRNPTSTSTAKFNNLTITGPYQSDGSNTENYSIILSDYDYLSGSIQCQDTYTIDNVTVNPSNQGLISVGTGTNIGNLQINTNSITKTAGSIFYSRTGNFNLGELSISGAPYNLLSGIFIGNIISNGAKTSIISSTSYEVYGKETLIINSGVQFNKMTGFTGQIINLMSFSNDSVIVHSSNISNSGGTNLTMTPNTVYRYIMLSNTTAKQI